MHQGFMALSLLALALSSSAFASPPSAPMSVTATAASATQISVAWSASSDTDGITGYLIQRCQGSGCSSFTQIGSVSGNTLTYLDSGLASGLTYQYQVYATDSANTTSAPSPVATGSPFPASVASSITYGYDALGRLVQAFVPALNVVENYSYDAGGNLLSIASSPASILAIANLSSSIGAPGSQLTLYGSGFSSTPSLDTVLFNGTGAAVVSATATQLVVTIPAAATSGTVTVSTPSSTVTAPVTFTVTGQPAPPQITGIPTAATVGSTIVVQGTGFSTTLSDNSVLINGLWATVTAATATTLTVVIPTTAVSNVLYGATAGPITVTTPFGTAVSATSILLAAQTYGATANAVVNAAPVQLNTAAASIYSAVLFTGTAGENLALAIAGVPSSGIPLVSVVAPNGTLLVNGASLHGGSNAIQIPTLPLSGTYVITVISSPPVSLSVSLLGPSQGVLILNGAPTTQTLSVAGQSADLTFSGQQGTYASLSFSNVTLPAATVTVLNPDGSLLAATPLTPNGATLLPQLPSTGTYTVLVVPQGAIGGAFTASLTSAISPTLVADQGTYQLTWNGSTTPINLSFEASAGQRFSLAVARGTSSADGTLTIRNPDGTTLTTAALGVCSYCLGSVLQLGPFPQTGSYTAVLQPTAGASGTSTLTLTSAATATVAMNSSSTITTTETGQTAAALFQGTAGQYASVAFTSQSYPASGVIVLIAPDGTTLGTQIFAYCPACNGSSWGVVSVGPLPDTGTYTALLQQTVTVTAPTTGTVFVDVATAVTGAITPGVGMRSSLVPGQGVQATFSGTAGQYVSIPVQAAWLDAMSRGTNAGVLSVLDPSGVAIAAAPLGDWCSYDECLGGVVTAGPLSETGEYTLLFQQSTGDQPLRSESFSANYMPVASGTMTLDTVTTVQLDQGQGYLGTISLTAGQIASIGVGTAGTPPEFVTGNVTVFSPSGAVLVTAPYSRLTAIGFGPVPMTGSYTVLFTQSAPSGITAFLEVQSPVAATLTPNSYYTGSIPQGSAQAFEGSFNASAGDYDSISVSVGNGAPATRIYVLSPSGTVLSQGLASYNCPSTCEIDATLNPGAMPVTGTYRLVVQVPVEGEYNGYPVNVLLSPGTAGTGASHSLNTGTSGQAVQFGFSGAAGQVLNLVATNLAFTPSSAASFAYVDVAPPSGPLVLNHGYCYASYCLLTLPALPQNGTYTVTITPAGAATMIGSATVTPMVIGALAVGSPVNVSLNTGEAALFTFAANAGQALALDVSGISTVPSNSFYTIGVLAPNGSVVGAALAKTGSTINLPNLLAGTYTVTVTDPSGLPPVSGTMQLLLGTDSSGALILNGGGVDVSTSTPGAVAYVALPASFGQSVSVAVSNLTLSPSGGYVTVPYANELGQGPLLCNPPSCVLHLPYMPQLQSNQVVFTPSTQATMDFTATLSPDVTGILSPGTPVNLSLSETGQSALLTFDITAEGGQSPSLYVSGLTSNPSNTTYLVTVYAIDNLPTNVAAGSLSISNSTGVTLNLPKLPVGSYAVLVKPSAPAVASMQITLEPAASAFLVGPGSSGQISTSAPGENVYVSFQGTAGQYIDLALTNLTSSTTSGSMTLTIVLPDGQPLQTAFCAANVSGCEIELASLPQTGTYTVTIAPPAVTATMGFTAAVAPPVTGTLTVGNPSTINLATEGQTAALSFTQPIAQPLALYVGSVSVSPSNTSLNVSVYNSSGTRVANGSTATAAMFNVPNLPAGVYTVLVVPAFPVTGSFQVTLEPPVSGTLPVDGTSHSYSTSAPGQDAYFSFAGNAGQSLSLAITSYALVPSSSALTAVVYDSSGLFVSSATCFYFYTSCGLHLAALPKTDTYSLVMVPPSAATSSFSLTLTADATGVLTYGTPLTEALASTGQSATLSFTLSSQQTIALYFSDVTVAPASTWLNVNIYNSSGLWIAGSYVSSSAALTLNAPNLAPGTYTVVVTPALPATSGFQVTLEPGASATVGVDGGSNGYGTSVPGQYAYLYFSGTAGESVSLALTGVATTPSGGTVAAQVYDPNGLWVKSLFCSTSSPGCELHLANLTRTGSYSIVLQSTGQMSFSAALFNDVSGTLTSGSPLAITLASIGQSATLSFDASASQNIALSVSSLSLTPSGTAVSLSVYNAAGTQIATTSTSGGTTLNLANLAAGTYSALITPAYPVTGSFQVGYQ